MLRHPFPLIFSTWLAEIEFPSTPHRLARHCNSSCARPPGRSFSPLRSLFFHFSVNNSWFFWHVSVCVCSDETSFIHYLIHSFTRFSSSSSLLSSTFYRSTFIFSFFEARNKCLTTQQCLFSQSVCHVTLHWTVDSTYKAQICRVLSCKKRSNATSKDFLMASKSPECSMRFHKKRCLFRLHQNIRSDQFNSLENLLEIWSDQATTPPTSVTLPFLSFLCSLLLYLSAMTQAPKSKSDSTNSTPNGQNRLSRPSFPDIFHDLFFLFPSYIHCFSGWSATHQMTRRAPRTRRQRRGPWIGGPCYRRPRWSVSSPTPLAFGGL